jgi:hypothetical protein
MTTALEECADRRRLPLRVVTAARRVPKEKKKEENDVAVAAAGGRRAAAPNPVGVALRDEAEAVRKKGQRKEKGGRARRNGPTNPLLLLPAKLPQILAQLDGLLGVSQILLVD